MKGERMKNRKVALIAFLVPVLLLTQAFACNSHKAAIAARDFRLALQAFQDGEIVWHQQGHVDNQTHIAVQSYIIDAANIGKQVDSAIAVGSNAGASALLNNLLASTDTLLANGTLHIKDPQTKALFETAILSIKTIIGNVQIQLGSKT
jgi:hypothetical protein